ncbi:MAG: cupin domain-containing protein [Flavobacteriales bacterium]|nr:cupin domain-containing protein [Flavobacteriales bacterium]
MKYTLLLLLSLISLSSIGQYRFNLEERSRQKPDENIEVQTITLDSLVSTHQIWIRSGVKAHFHEYHTEHVFVLEGQAMMTIDGEEFLIGPGDLVFIPKGSVHSVVVLSDQDLVVLSVQAPAFRGKDRIFIQAKEGGTSE